MHGPIITGELLRLRPPRPEDAPAMATWFEDLEVTAFLKLQHPPSAEMEREWVDRMARDPNEIIWVIEVEGRAVGSTGIHRIDWKHGTGSTGTVIADKALWGKGIARELMRVRADYAFTHLPLRKLHSSYIEGNTASARAQTSAGYREVGRWRAERWANGRWRDLVLTELMREDWESRASV